MNNNTDQIDLEIKTLEKMALYLENPVFIEDIKISNPLESVTQSLDNYYEHTKNLKVFK